MRIGIMLRHFDQHGGGVKVYTQNMLRELLALDTDHEFILLYQDPRLLGTYRNKERVRELVIPAPTVFLWDQVAVRRAEKKEKLDLLFNPKYSIPLLARCRTAFVCHGLDWYVMPWGSKRIDRLNHRHLIPRYTEKADAIIAVSNTTREHVIDYLKADESKVHTVYHGVDEAFRKPIHPELAEKVRLSHRLPKHYFLYCGQIYPPKNFGRLLRAYAQVGPALGISLVVAGEHRWLCHDELGLIRTLGLSPWIIQLGWIDRATLPAIYSMARALLLPSLYESFGLPLVEAMASGCPIVTANRYATRELAGEAAVLVDPEDIDSIADGIRNIASDEALRQRLVTTGHIRARDFSWQQCAKQTLQVFEYL